MKASFLLQFLCILILTGKVIAVTDGDTFTLLTPEKKQVKIRLEGIDAPERRQSYGTQAREHLAGMVFQKDVRVEVVDKDHYGRSIGRVKVDRVDVNHAMVKDGYAWWYQKYAPSNQKLQKAEALARREKRGLWAAEDGKAPQAPWDFRKKNDGCFVSEAQPKKPEKPSEKPKRMERRTGPKSTDFSAPLQEE